MTDLIEIDRLLVRTLIGINPDEREQKQDVVIDLRLHCDCRPAGKSDDIEDAVNYRTVTKDVIELVESTSDFLVEHLAESIAALCLKDPRVEKVRVRVRKPGALRFAKSVGVCITRSRRD